MATVGNKKQTKDDVLVRVANDRRNGEKSVQGCKEVSGQMVLVSVPADIRNQLPRTSANQNHTHLWKTPEKEKKTKK